MQPRLPPSLNYTCMCMYCRLGNGESRLMPSLSLHVSNRITVCVVSELLLLCRLREALRSSDTM